MTLQKTSTVGTPLQKCSSKTSRYILLGYHYAPHPWDLSLTSAGQSSLVQAARPHLSGQQHLQAGCHACPHWPQMCQGAGRWHMHPSNQIPLCQEWHFWLGRGFTLTITDQNATHVVKQIPVPLRHCPNECIRSKRDSCWGYKYKNSMTLCSLRGSNLPPPPGPPGAPEEEGRVFSGTGVSEVLVPPPDRAPRDTVLG